MARPTAPPRYMRADPMAANVPPLPVPQRRELPPIQLPNPAECPTCGHELDWSPGAWWKLRGPRMVCALCRYRRRPTEADRLERRALTIHELAIRWAEGEIVVLPPDIPYTDFLPVSSMYHDVGRPMPPPPESSWK